MARAGDVIENPRSGEKITFEQTGAETNGQFLAGKVYLAPHGAGPPEHIHPRMTERFTVLKGRLTATLAGSRRDFGPDEELVVSPGTPHRWWNETAEETILEYHVSPALPLDRFLENVFAMAHLGYTDTHGLAGPLRMSRILPQFWDVLHLARPPLPVQKALMFLFGLIARLLRYPTEYPYPYAGGRS